MRPSSAPTSASLQVAGSQVQEERPENTKAGGRCTNIERVRLIRIIARTGDFLQRMKDPNHKKFEKKADLWEEIESAYLDANYEKDGEFQDLFPPHSNEPPSIAYRTASFLKACICFTMKLTLFKEPI